MQLIDADIVDNVYGLHISW